MPSSKRDRVVGTRNEQEPGGLLHQDSVEKLAGVPRTGRWLGSLSLAQEPVSALLQRSRYCVVRPTTPAHR